MKKQETSDQFPKGFFKQFKDKETFQEYFNSLFKRGIEEMLQCELDEHLGYLKHSQDGYNTGNSRNGSFPKTIYTLCFLYKSGNFFRTCVNFFQTSCTYFRSISGNKNFIIYVIWQL